MLLAVRLSSCGCTWEVWRAREKLELLEAYPAFSRTIQTSRVHPKLDIRTLSINQFLNVLNNSFWKVDVI